MKITNLHTLTNRFKYLYGKSFGTQVKYLWNDAWKEMPEIMFMSILSFGASIPLIYCSLQRNNGLPPRYYREITIFRPDDPKVPHIRKDNSLLLQRKF